MRRRLIGIVALVALGALASACGTAKLTKQQQRDVNNRETVYQKAVGQVPTPNITNFPRRKTLADATVRQSLPNHPWYVYVLGQNGSIVNYFVAKSVPVNDCDYLSSTDNVTNGTGPNTGSGNVVTQAPSLEGIYQSPSGCNTLTFFDLSTDAEIQVSSLQTFVTDRPLKVDAQPIKVNSK